MDTMTAFVLNLVQAAGPRGESHNASWTPFPPLSRPLLPAVACMAAGQLAITRWLECKGALLAQWPWRTPFFYIFFETRPRRFRGESRGDLQGEHLLFSEQGDYDDEMRVAMDGAEHPEQVYRSEKSSTVWQVNFWAIWTVLGEMQSGRKSEPNAMSSSKILKAGRCHSSPRGSV